MNDREMVYFLYGVLKMMPNVRPEILRLLEKHLGISDQPTMIGPEPLMKVTI